MATYKAPLRDIEFVLNEIAGVHELTRIPRYAEMTPDLVIGVLDEAAKLFERTVAPLNRGADEEGARFHADTGDVSTPKGFKEAYDAFRKGGWLSLAMDPEYGGQGLAYTLSIAVNEMLIASNLSFSAYSLLSVGAYEAIYQHAAKELKDLYLPKLATGEWSGTQCLTEPHAGSDVGLGRTKAERAGDGTYRITGTKIFITAGEHDLSRNIIHMVLARLPDGPPGIRGISLFLIPKFLVNPDGGLGERNGVRCGGIEHKMGIKASATCVINFNNAVGYLVGQEHRGIQHMFTMMNGARLGVALHGLGLGEFATQNAVAYAKERRQGRPLTHKGDSSNEAVPIIQHPDVRRMLLTMKAYTEGCRMLMYDTAKQVDLMRHHPDPEAREQACDYVDLMTPVVKAFVTDTGFEVANLGVQVYGGAGYIREHGMEQTVRDARIPMIYEGTNGIQALDLVGRKLPMHNGRLLRRFFQPVQVFLEAESANPDLGFITGPLRNAFTRLQATTAWMAERGLNDPRQPAAGACEYLRLLGLTALGYFWARAARTALPKAAEPFYRAKLATARFYAAKLLPQVDALAASVMAGAETVMAPDEADF